LAELRSLIEPNADRLISVLECQSATEVIGRMGECLVDKSGIFCRFPVCRKS
jgi:hypothetical protein